MTNLEALKQYIQTLTAEQFANLCYHPDEDPMMSHESDNFCRSVPDCSNMTCVECFVNWLETEVK